MSITSAYNFVPLSSEVFFPEWADEVSQDMPLEDGYSGTLSLRIKNHTPILPGQEHDKVIEHFRLPDGKLAIPGSTLRGMIRSVLEVASYGKMQFIDDRRYSIRDLTPGARPIYGDKFTTSYSRQFKNHPSQGPFEPKSKAGWLYFDKQLRQWKIQPCEYSRVDAPDLAALCKSSWDTFRKSAKDDGEKRGPTAVDKYQWWIKNCKSGAEKMRFDFSVGPVVDHKHSKTRDGHEKYLRYSKATALEPGEFGHLVFTGQPSDNKHLEFVFHSDSQESLAIDMKVVQGFRSIYVKPTESKSEANLHYEYLKAQAQAGCFESKGIPVFYLLEKGRISSLGLSLMYKLPYTHSVGEMVDLSSGNHRSVQAPDLAELIFGRVVEEHDPGKEQLGSLKGRVSFSMATSDNATAKYMEQRGFVKTILNGPKPTYYPNYIEQATEEGISHKVDNYKTMMDDDARIRGWKRYPVSRDHQIPAPEKGQGENVISKLKPLNGSVSYLAKLRFHNLSPIELGAMIWCITWGQDPSLRHSVGMGKSFGLGQISIEIDEPASDLIANNPALSAPTLIELCIQFEMLMNDRYPNWRETDQITQLLAMANPELGDRSTLVAMKLNQGQRGKNEFVNAKKGMFILPPHAERGSVAKKVVRESDKWLEDNIAALIKGNANAKPRDIVCGKALANAWLELEDPDKMADVLPAIKAKWDEHGGWEGPHSGRSRKTAYKIYTDWEHRKITA